MLKNTIDFGIFIFAAMASFNFGYQAICLAPNHEKKFIFYMVSQGVLCAIWLVFAIISAGSINGWTKIKLLHSCKLGFSIFLCIVESLLYLFSAGLGVFCMIKTKIVNFKVKLIVAW